MLTYDPEWCIDIIEFLTTNMIPITDSDKNRVISWQMYICIYLFITVRKTIPIYLYGWCVTFCCKTEQGWKSLGLCIFCRSVFSFRSKLTIADPSLGFYVNLTSGLCCLYVKFKGDFPAKCLAIMASAQHVAGALFPVFCGICWPKDLYRLLSSILQ